MYLLPAVREEAEFYGVVCVSSSIWKYHPSSFVHMMCCVVERLYLATFPDNYRYEQDPAFEFLYILNNNEKDLETEDKGDLPDLGTVFTFCQDLDHRLESTDRLLAVVTSTDARCYLKSVFLIGAYILMKLGKDLQSTLHYLDPIMPTASLERNGSNSSAINFHLHDYLAGLHRAKNIGWVDFIADRFDFDEYRQLDSPLNADLHEVVPGKIFMMRGPRDLNGGVRWRDIPKEDGRFGHREFSPAHYAEILEQLDVCAVVRCSAPAYDRVGFEAAGIAVVDLCCEDGAAPPIDVVSKFLAVAERLPGALAVHCGSGRGRSGTLVALYLMKHHGFSAREAMGWLRIVRPGW